MLVVKKFGGAAIATPARIMSVARYCAEDFEKGDDVVIVLSSMGDTTDELVSKARQLNEKPSKRELDVLIATGDQTAAALMAVAMDSLGIRSVSMNGQQIGVKTTGGYGASRIQSIESARILRELEDRRVVIVAGGQGYNRYDDVTTLGRGGADATAVALAAELKADSCEIYSEHAAIYTADPKICPDAKPVKAITYDELMELNLTEKTAVASRSVEMAKKYGITLVLRSSRTGEIGTVVKEERDMEQMMLSSVSLDTTADRISVIGLKDEPGVAFRLFSLLAKGGINIDLILQSFGHDGLEDISFTVADVDTERTMELLEENRKRLKYQKLDLNRDKAKLTVVGAGLIGTAGGAAKLFEALYNEDINIDMITTSEIRLTVLVGREDGERAVRAVHAAFGMGR